VFGQFTRDTSSRAVARHRRAVLDEALQQRQRKTRRFARAAAMTSLPLGTA